MSSRQSTKVECICEVCKKSFLVKASHAKRRHVRFCSMVCRKSTRIKCVCESCGSEFFVIPGRFKLGATKFCSEACRYPAKVELHCEVCGSSFLVKPSRAKRGNARFCSKKCYYKSYPTTPLSELFSRHIGETTDRGCIIWNGYKNKSNGYGMTHDAENRSTYAHRIAWELANGPIPDGLWVLHKCDNPPCVNVEHLFLGTRQDNIDDMVSKGRQRKGEDHHNSKLSHADIQSIRQRYETGESSQISLAKEFGVHVVTISSITTRRCRKYD